MKEFFEKLSFLYWSVPLFVSIVRNEFFHVIEDAISKITNVPTFIFMVIQTSFYLLIVFPYEFYQRMFYVPLSEWMPIHAWLMFIGFLLLVTKTNKLTG
jgi:hypothetical protein